MATDAQNYVTKDEFSQYSQRIDAENTRQNKRIEELEDKTKEMTDMTISLSKLTSSVEQMVQEQKKQGERLQKIEDMPARNWDTMKTSIITGICSALATAIVAAMITFL